MHTSTSQLGSDIDAYGHPEPQNGNPKKESQFPMAIDFPECAGGVRATLAARSSKISAGLWKTDLKSMMEPVEDSGALF